MNSGFVANFLPILVAAPISFWVSRYFKEFSFMTRSAAGFAAAMLGYELGAQLVQIFGWA